MATDVDIAICGAGPVGLALAALLASRGMAASRIVLIDAKSVEQTSADPRSIALSWGSRQLLEQVHAWPVAATPIREIHVSRRGHFGRTLIDCADHGLPALGYVTRYGTLVAALENSARSAGIQAMRPLQLVASNEAANGVWLQLEGGRSLSAQILVQAEGGVFSEQGAKSTRRDYEQTAIVAQVTADKPLPERAFERFTDQGPLALLPLEDGYSLVWCMHPDAAQRIAGLDDNAFLAELQQAFGTRLGRFLSASRRHAFPLGLNAGSATLSRTVAIGNAAQTLHPVAGQGLNLGLRDAAVLARMLASNPTPAGLVEFRQARRSDRSLTVRLTDIMARIFASAPDGAFSQSVLGASLSLLDFLPPARRLLAEHMMFGKR